MNGKQAVVDLVKEKYGAVALSGLSSNNAGVREVAEAFGYTQGELQSIPAEANMGLSCGNPTAIANLKPGEVVVDLGSGGGLDVFLAARKVGPSGRAIGIDMTGAMIELAKKNALSAKDADGLPLKNVDFYESTMESMPLPDGSVDCVISNCVINLAADKAAVFREIARILKPGGRLAISDIALKRVLPESIASNVMAHVGCIAGALLIDDYRRELQTAGFGFVEIIDSHSDLNAYGLVENQAGCCSPAMGCQSGLPIVELGSTLPAPQETQRGDDFHGQLAKLLESHDINQYAASVQVLAVKSQ